MVEAIVNKVYAHYEVTLGSGKCIAERTVNIFDEIDPNNPVNQYTITALGANFKQANQMIDNWLKNKNWKEE